MSEREMAGANELEIEAREVRVMMELMGWNQTEAADLADVTGSLVSQILQGQKPAGTVWKALVLKVAALKVRELPLVFAGRWRGENAAVLHDAPRWPRWAEPLFQALAQLEERERAETVAAILQLLRTGPEEISSGARKEAEELLRLAGEQADLELAEERRRRAAKSASPSSIRSARRGGA